jgi:hypothetical protein
MSIELKTRIVDWPMTIANFKRAAELSNKSVKRIVQQVTIWAGQSAIKLTPPSKSSIKRLPRKYKIRPVVTLGKGKDKYKAVKYWNKKANRFDYFPIAKNETADATAAIRQIPAAGAAKAGWLFALRAIGRMENDSAPIKMRTLGTGRLEPHKGVLNNLVSYADKIGPSVATEAANKAWRRFLASTLATQEKKKNDKMVIK